MWTRAVSLWIKREATVHSLGIHRWMTDGDEPVEGL